MGEIVNRQLKILSKQYRNVEEVSEEALYDVTRVTFNLLNSFRGGKTQLKTFDNALERYGSSFFGGFLGGGIFEGVNVKDYINSNINRPYDPTNKEATMATLSNAPKIFFLIVKILPILLNFCSLFLLH